MSSKEEEIINRLLNIEGDLEELVYMIAAQLDIDPKIILHSPHAKRRMAERKVRNKERDSVSI